MKLTHSLQRNSVKHLRPQPPLTTSPHATVRETISLMQERRSGYVLICDADGRAAGIFTERDLLQRVIGERADLDSPMGRLMTRELAAVRAEDPITRALGVLHDRGLRHLPVLDGEGRPTGMISVRRILEYLVEFFPQHVYNLPPEPSSVLESREGA